MADLENGTNPNSDGQGNDDIINDDTTIIEGDDDTEIIGDESGDVENQDDDPAAKEKQINQEAVNKKINKLHSEKRIAEDKAAEERQSRIAVEEKLKALTEKAIPAVPEIPDFMDPDYLVKMDDRDKIITAHAQKKFEDDIKADDLAKKNQAEATSDQEKVNGMVKNFDKRAKDMALDKATLVDSQNLVGSYLKGKTDLARFLLADENGPLTVLYLSQNVEELQKIAVMDSMSAAVYIAKEISPKAVSLKPKTKPGAPAPTYSPRGKKITSSKDPYLEGAKFY